MDLRCCLVLLGSTFLVSGMTTTQIPDRHIEDDEYEQELTASPVFIGEEYATEKIESIHEDDPSLPREKRQIGGPAQEAMARSLTNNPVGRVEFGRPTMQNGHFVDRHNFGGRFGGSAGVKVWESGRQSVGLGAATHANAGLHGGRPYANSPQVGAGLGYRNGQFSATAGVNHGYLSPYQRRPTTNYGLGIGYRFKRALEAEDDVLLPETLEVRHKRQIGGPAREAMDRSLTTNPVGQIEVGRPTLDNPYFADTSNFGGRVGGSAGVKVWESGRQSVGVGAAAQANAGLNEGRPYVNSPEVGAGLGYRNGQFSATAGVNHGYQNQFQRRPETSYGVGIGYNF